MLDQHGHVVADRAAVEIVVVRFDDTVDLFRSNGRELSVQLICELMDRVQLVFVRDLSAQLNVVIDRGVRIPEGLVVGEDPELDAKRFRMTENGICLITQPMIDGLNA